MAHAGLSSHYMKSPPARMNSYSSKSSSSYSSSYDKPLYGRTSDYSSYSYPSKQRDSLPTSQSLYGYSAPSYSSNHYSSSSSSVLPSLNSTSYSRAYTTSDRLSRKDSYTDSPRSQYLPSYDKSYVPSSYRPVSKYIEKFSNIGRTANDKSPVTVHSVSKGTSDLSLGASLNLRKSFSQFDISSPRSDKSEKVLKPDDAKDEFTSRFLKRNHPSMGVNSTSSADKRLGGNSEDNSDGCNNASEKVYKSNYSRRSPSFDTRGSNANQEADIVRTKRFSSVDRFGSGSYGDSADKGCTGLRNLGNTCFMNSVLQCLANTRPLLEYCLNSEFEPDINKETSRMKGLLISSYADLMKSMWSGKDCVSPTNFKYEVSRFARMFIGCNQQDGQEFLLYLLQGLHEDVNRVREKKKIQMDLSNEVELTSASEKSSRSWKEHLELDNSKIVDLFEGQLKSALTCTVCGYVSNTFDPVLGLSLPIKKTRGMSDVTLTDCLELFTQEEILDDNERTTCAKCKKKQKSTKQLSIQKFPQILVINLKRFNDENLYRSKLSTNVKCPIKNLDMRRFSDERVAGGAVYDLYALCNHTGTPSGGHYTAAAKNPYNSEWHYFNDHRVSSMSESNVVTSEAYILFYELSTSSSGL